LILTKLIIIKTVG